MEVERDRQREIDSWRERGRQRKTESERKRRTDIWEENLFCLVHGLIHQPDEQNMWIWLMV